MLRLKLVGDVALTQIAAIAFHFFITRMLKDFSRVCFFGEGGHFKFERVAACSRLRECEEG
jgi:hypothetical protein